MLAKNHPNISPEIRQPQDWPHVDSISSGNSDFMPELHRSNAALMASRLFGETMTTKTANTADAKQKRGK
jgi:hypothetical protein